MRERFINFVNWYFMTVAHGAPCLARDVIARAKANGFKEGQINLYSAWMVKNKMLVKYRDPGNPLGFGLWKPYEENERGEKFR